MLRVLGFRTWFFYAFLLVGLQTVVVVYRDAHEERSLCYVISAQDESDEGLSFEGCFQGRVCQEEHLKLRRVGLEQASSTPNDGTNSKRAAAYHREDLRQAQDRRGECQVI